MIDFVGAGPGAVDLITVRGKNLIEKADVIIYAGSLVNSELLNFAKKGCQIYNSAEMTLEEITSVMVSAEMDGKNTVRLHTGDPSIYGAIKEQMNILDKYNLEYKVCPGVSSLFGAAASLKTEYTIPHVSQSVIITRMEGKTPVSAGMLNELSRKLIRGGYKSDTPAAIVYKATWNDEKVIKTTVSEIAKSAEKNNINKTALIIIGDFLGNNYKRSLLYNPSFSHEFRKGD